MVRVIKQHLRRLVESRGYSISRKSDEVPIECTALDLDLIRSVQPYTMTSFARLWALLASTKYIFRNGVPGDFVECGVWRGGSAALMGLALQNQPQEERRIWLYDTFAGMTEPSDRDVEEASQKSAETLLRSTPIGDGNNVWAVASMADLSATFARVNLDPRSMNVVPGDVRVTVRSRHPESIALLRLDTDFYDSTLSELEVLYPLLVEGGVCIIDDYGHWRGARAAVDEYFGMQRWTPLLLPIDQTGRLFIKGSTRSGPQ